MEQSKTAFDSMTRTRATAQNVWKIPCTSNLQQGIQDVRWRNGKVLTDSASEGFPPPLHAASAAPTFIACVSIFLPLRHIFIQKMPTVPHQ